MKKHLIKKMMSVYSCNREWAEFYADYCIESIIDSTPGCKEEWAVHAILKTL